ncbi:shikimate kinase [Staphylospora marina]|uniref:shikimate kinase n=1 Tax=Staphylospora marina TaxID=2490858 RepID=UPI000F5BE26B|nr:shikimate kinase [Staphylospora marina]
MPSEKRHLILIGMMGSGKSTVGRMLAAESDMPFVDLDAEIEKSEGMTVDLLFRKKGEEAFRDAEVRVLKRWLSQKRSHVIATGGGSVLRPENRERMSRAGWVVFLRAAPETLIRRLAGSREIRPLLTGNTEERVRTLCRERAGIYDFADWTVDTDELSAEQTVRFILNKWRRMFKEKPNR